MQLVRQLSVATESLDVSIFRSSSNSIVSLHIAYYTSERCRIVAAGCQDGTVRVTVATDLDEGEAPRTVLPTREAAAHAHCSDLSRLATSLHRATAGGPGQWTSYTANFDGPVTFARSFVAITGEGSSLCSACTYAYCGLTTSVALGVTLHDVSAEGKVATWLERLRPSASPAAPQAARPIHVLLCTALDGAFVCRYANLWTPLSPCLCLTVQPPVHRPRTSSC